MNSILHIAPFFEGSTSERRTKVFENLGFHVERIDLDPFVKFWQKGLISLARKTPYSYFQYSLNKFVREKCRFKHFDYIICEKPKFFTTKTLKLLSSCTEKLVHFSPDDYYNPSNQGWFESGRLALYDVIITNKLHNVLPLSKQYGESKVRHMLSGGPELQRSLSSKSGKYQISFIGQYEEARYETLMELSRRVDAQIHVFGPDWNSKGSSEYIIFHEPVWGPSFSKTIRCSNVNLCFLRKANSDTSTTRTFEIVGNGGLLLAERTDEHRSLFEEDQEALFFDNIDELTHKINYCLNEAHSREIIRIKYSGMRRYVASGYSDLNVWGKFFDIS